MEEKKAKVSPGEFFNQVKVEARKVVWPSRQETIQTGIFVGILMLILAIFFLGVDSLFGYIVRTLLSLA
jgi:preprotein translocase subunit SecE